jgi:23S rRNA (pseudouridine1915-N3)-methyltransferase
MRVVLASVSARGGKSKLGATDALVEEYFARLGAGRASQARGWISVEARVFATEAELLQAAGRGDAKAKSKTQGAKAKSAPVMVWLDSGGKSMTSEQFASWLGARRDGGVQEIWMAVGPADGWSRGTDAQSKDANDLWLSLGAMTLPHELARVVAAEQLYRAWAILEGHPYHKGH